jgi:hypothetical protein
VESSGFYHFWLITSNIGYKDNVTLTKGVSMSNSLKKIAKAILAVAKVAKTLAKPLRRL